MLNRTMIACAVSLEFSKSAENQEQTAYSYSHFGYDSLHHPIEIPTLWQEQWKQVEQDILDNTPESYPPHTQR